MESKSASSLSVKIDMASFEAGTRTACTMDTCSAPVFDCTVRLSGLARATCAFHAAKGSLRVCKDCH